MLLTFIIISSIVNFHQHHLINIITFCFSIV